MIGISLSTLKRLPLYLHYLKSIRGKRKNISATFLAGELNLGDVQVRKDLALVSSSGKPKTGYDVNGLVESLEAALGCKKPTVAIITGVGNLGRALLSYGGFADYGLSVVAGFDTDDAVIGKMIGGKPVLSETWLEDFVKDNGVRLAILTLPDSAAQGMADRLSKAGIRGIWNFTNAHITVPETVAVMSENMAASLALLNIKMT